MSAKRSISLTSQWSVPSGSHILYFHTEKQSYADNAAAFISKGLELGQVVLFIEREEDFGPIRARVTEACGEERLESLLHFIDRDEFYRTSEDFRFEHVLESLDQLIRPHLRTQLDLRLWGHVDWRRGQQDIAKRLYEYECKADLALNELGYLTVCAYDALEVPAAIQNELMKSHEYLMTDDALVLSNLYRHKRNAGLVFPTLSAQSEIETEADLYKQKLDFVHVVSHEVRNPLTVIKAYARMVGANVEAERDRERLQAIVDYVDLIDNEISHIINTEELLSSEALWHRRLVSAQELLRDVVDIMEVKARTQGISLTYVSSLTGRETLLANAIGFRMIISNLLGNAIKYSEEGGRVACLADVREDRLHVEIRDEGVGMTEHQLSRLFRKYEKMNEERGGQGIGLYMAKRLLDHFEGDIALESAPGVGTTVRISFPIRML